MFLKKTDNKLSKRKDEICVCNGQKYCYEKQM